MLTACCIRWHYSCYGIFWQPRPLSNAVPQDPLQTQTICTASHSVPPDPPVCRYRSTLSHPLVCTAKHMRHKWHILQKPNQRGKDHIIKSLSFTCGCGLDRRSSGIERWSSSYWYGWMNLYWWTVGLDRWLETAKGKNINATQERSLTYLRVLGFSAGEWSQQGQTGHRGSRVSLWGFVCWWNL